MNFLLPIGDETVKGSCSTPNFRFRFSQLARREITQPAREVNAVSDFSQRADRNAEVSQPCRWRLEGASLNNVRRHRVSRASQLRGELKALVARQSLSRKPMYREAEIVGTLPGDELLVWL
jgi:hypothetical protein